MLLKFKQHAGDYVPGQTVRRDEIRHGDVDWWLRAGAVEVVGGLRPGMTLLPDNPTPEQYQEEVGRLQEELVRAHEELDHLRQSRPLPPPAASESGRLTDQEAAVSELARVRAELASARAELRSSESLTRQYVEENDRLRDESYKLSERLTELETAARGQPAATANPTADAAPAEDAPKEETHPAAAPNVPNVPRDQPKPQPPPGRRK